MIDWELLAREAAEFRTAVLSFQDVDGMPFSLRCQARIQPDKACIELSLPAYIVIESSPASLLWHRHDERLGQQKNFIVRGHLHQQQDQYIFDPLKLIYGAGFGGLMSTIKAMQKARADADAYLARHQLERPVVDWEAFKRLRSENR